jgi:phosphatidylglycerol:prolipoprotein diacylglycerol transferase
LLGFAALHFYSKKRKYDGEIFVLYLGWYGIGRAWIEGLRTDSLYLFGTGLRVSQMLALLCVLASVGLTIYNRVIKTPDEDDLYANRLEPISVGETESTEEAEYDAELEEILDQIKKDSENEK